MRAEIKLAGVDLSWEAKDSDRAKNCEILFQSAMKTQRQSLYLIALLLIRESGTDASLDAPRPMDLYRGILVMATALFNNMQRLRC